MDVLTDVLTAARISNSITCQPALDAPWGLSFSASDQAAFHILRRGIGWLTADDTSAPIKMAQGDVLLLPHGSAHSLVDHPDTPTRPIESVPPTPFSLHPDTETVFFCGVYSFEDEDTHPLRSLLPPVIHIRADQATATTGLTETIGLLLGEVATDQPGADATSSRLADVLLVLILRAWLQHQPERTCGWLGALRDPNIRASLTAIHADPGADWTVDNLARHATMSRATFSRRFNELVGEPPFAYVTRWRMLTANRLLRDSSYPIGVIAQRVGYQSEASFSRAFGKTRGTTPGRFRQNATTQLSSPD